MAVLALRHLLAQTHEIGWSLIHHHTATSRARMHHHPASVSPVSHSSASR